MNETDGAVHWNSWVQNCGEHFRRPEDKKFSDTDWLQHVDEGSNKMRFQDCENSINSLMYVRAIQGHTGGNLVAPELMGHVTIPYRWKEFLLHRGCSFDITSILKPGLIP